MRTAAALTRRTVPRAADLLRQAIAAIADLGGGLTPKMRRRLLLLGIVLCALGAVYQFWFRDSSLVRVEHVTVAGLTGTDADRERAAVTAAAKQMTTLHVNEDVLLKAIGPGAAVESLHVSSDFPHGLHVEVVETSPVAILVQGSTRVAVGARGVLLPHVRVAGADVATIDVGALPSGLRLGRGRALRLVSAAAAVPVGLRPRVTRIRELPGKGLVAYLRHGPLVILGGAGELEAKWAATAAVLADPASRGASYVDARWPGRPVAGGLDVPPPAPADQSGAPAGGAGATTPGATGATTPGAATTTTPGATAPAAPAATQTPAQPATTTPQAGAAQPSTHP